MTHSGFARQYRLVRTFLPLLFSIQFLHATAPPLICPGGAPLGRFDLTVLPPVGGEPRNIQTVNRLLEGDTIVYRPVEIDSPEKKKARISLLLVPEDGSKIVVFEPLPADKAASWTVPFRATLASLVWGPAGLDKSKVTGLVAKDHELIGQLADYAAKTEETQALIEAITQQQTLASGQNLDAAVAGFASQYSPNKLNRTEPTDVQLGVLLHSVNPTLSTYDPLAQNPQQQAAQTAGLAAAVAGMFFGSTGIGLAATGGQVLINLHSMAFPHTKFLSALAQSDHGDQSSSGHDPDDPASTALCGNKPPDLARTEFAFLWALRFPDATAPVLNLKTPRHVAIGVKATLPLVLDSGNWKLVPRIQDWKLVSDDNSVSLPVSARINAAAKAIDLDLTSSKLRPGVWQLAAQWDWDPLRVSGNLVLHNFSEFTSARLTPESQDELTPAAGTLDLQLTGDDFEFVNKIEFKKQADPFAQPEELPFHLPKEPANGPETSLKVRLDAKSLATGNYVFLIAQSDGKVHEAPFKVLPAPPSISGTPIVLNTGLDSQTVVLHGTGLDRVEQITTRVPGLATLTLGDADDSGDGTERSVTVKLQPGVKAGTLLPLELKVRDYEEPVSVDDAFLVAGPRPAITTVRESSQNDLGTALNPGEMVATSLVSFELGVLHAPSVSEVDLSCENAPDSPPLKIRMGDAKDPIRLAQESADTLFLSFLPRSAGPPGCTVMASLVTPKSGQSNRRKLGTIVMLPEIDSFQLTSDKAGDTSYFAVIDGRDLEGIVKVGWDAQAGTPVDTIPMPVAGPGNKESLRIAVPWPAPAPHAPLYIWLRGEDRGRLTSAKY